MIEKTFNPTVRRLGRTHDYIEGVVAFREKRVTDAGKALPKVKALATHLLVEILGPVADDVCLKIEAAQDMPHFIAAMKLAYAVVREVRGQSLAGRFGLEVENQMPPV